MTNITFIRAVGPGVERHLEINVEDAAPRTRR